MVASVRHFGYSPVVSRPVVSILMTSQFSPSTLENSVFKKHRFQIAPLWRAFSNSSVFGDRFRRCSVDDSRIRGKTAPFSFENGLVWTGLFPHLEANSWLACTVTNVTKEVRHNSCIFVMLYKHFFFSVHIVCPFRERFSEFFRGRLPIFYCDLM